MHAPPPLRPPARSCTWLRPGLAALVAIAFSAGCPAAARGPDIGRLPMLTSDDPGAESDLRAADELRAHGDLDGAAARYRTFLDKRPNDRLRPVAELALGQVFFEQHKYEPALALFGHVAQHPEPAIAEQGRFHAGLCNQRLGHDREAVDALAPMVGRTIEPTDTALLLASLAEAYVHEGRVADAVITLQGLSEDNAPEPDHKAARTRIVALVNDTASPADIRRLFDELDHDSHAFRYVALRAVRDADAAHDLDRTRVVLDAIKHQNIPFDESLAAIALRAERPSDANPAAIGAILSLSGRARKVGELALRGLMLAAGLPQQGPPAANAPQLVLRDDGLDPATAASAVSELVSVHRVIAIIGPMDAQVALAAGKRAQELGVPLIALTPGGALSALGPMVFRYFPTPRSETNTLVMAARARGAHRVAVLYPQNPYGEAMRAAFEQEAAGAGLVVDNAHSYAASATSFGPEAAALAKGNFDALFVADSSTQLALIAPALAAAGLWSTPQGQRPPQNGRAITLLAPSVAFDPDLPRVSGRYLQGALFSNPFDAQSSEGPAHDFVEHFKAQYGANPDAFAAFAHDAYRLIRASIEAGATTRAALADRLTTIRPNTLAGPSPGFNAAREPERATSVFELTGDHFATVAAH